MPSIVTTISEPKVSQPCVRKHPCLYKAVLARQYVRERGRCVEVPEWWGGQRGVVEKGGGTGNDLLLPSVR